MLAKMAAEYSVADLAFRYPDEAETDLEKLFLLPDIEEAQIYDARGQLFASKARPEANLPPFPQTLSPDAEEQARFNKDRIEVLAPMKFRGERYGTLRLVGSTISFQRTLNTRLAILGAFSGLILLLVYGTAWVLQRWISIPIFDLIDKVKKIAGGDFSIRVAVPNYGGEITSLGQNLNLMADSLEKLNFRFEQLVRERTAQLEQANKELEAFSYSVSHDLRAPLRGIDGWAHAILEDCGDRLGEQGHDFLNRVLSEAQHMEQLIDGLLLLSRVTRSQLQFEQVDLTATAEKIAVRLRDANPDRKLEISVQPALIAHGDAVLLEAVLVNLMENACKFTKQCDVAKIEFTRTEVEGEDVFSVRDNGVGFSMEYADKLFGTFQRLHSASEYPGTGIGLATVARIIHRHGGRVWGESRPGTGAVFSFTLGRTYELNCDSHC